MPEDGHSAVLAWLLLVKQAIAPGSGAQGSVFVL